MGGPLWGANMCNLCNVEGRETGIVYVETADNREPQNFALLDTHPRRFGDTVNWLCLCRCQSVAGKRERSERAA